MALNKIILLCEKCQSRNYSFSKSNFQKEYRLEVNKYCRKCNKHLMHKETR